MATHSHPTRERLIATMVELLDGDDPEHVTADQVLQQSGISKGSLYHHFEDYEDLVEAALVYRFSRTVDDSIALLTNVVTDSQTQEDVVTKLREFNSFVHDPSRRQYRLERARAAGMAFSSPRFEQVLGEEQERLTFAFMDLIREAQNRGWFRKELDPLATAVFIQAYTIGRLVDDISPQKVSPQEWNNIVDEVLTRVLLAD